MDGEKVNQVHGRFRGSKTRETKEDGLMSGWQESFFSQTKGLRDTLICLKGGHSGEETQTAMSCGLKK